MDWQTLMAALEAWLWKSPYLDVPNYAWIASGLGLLVLVLYLYMIFFGPNKPDSSAAETAAPLPSPEPPAPQPRPEKIEAAQTAAIATPPPEPVSPVPAPVPAPLPEKIEAPAEEPLELAPPEGWFSRLRKGLAKTQDKLSKGLNQLFASGKISDDLLDELEELLITSDLGVQTSLKLLTRLRAAVKKENLQDGNELREWLKKDILAILVAAEQPLAVPADQSGPYVIMVTGVNGTGKTTTIGKLALRFKQDGKSVLIGAADTFRAAAIQQLEIWGQRAQAPVISHQEGADPSAVAFDAIKAAEARHQDVVIIDTAGRLHTKVNLMEELKKVKRITGRELPGAPHEILLVLDATTGQNAVQQAKMFHEALGVTGLVLTKLDGTAKGGIIIAISDEFKIPIRFIGVGEKISDLQPFRAQDFVDAIFS